MLSNTMDTPALRHFATEEHNLTDATLYVRYSTYNDMINFYVSKGGKMESAFAKTAEHIDYIVTTLLEQNAHSLDLDALSAKWKGFLTVVNNGAVTVFKSIGEVPASKCDICESYHFGKLEMEFVPAFPELGMDKASLRLEWERSCSDQRFIAGELEAVRVEALAMLDEIVNVAMTKNEIVELRSLIAGA